MILLPITSIIAALLALAVIPLAMQISIRRIALGKAAGDPTAVVFGDGDDAILRRRIRAFGNFIEYVPVALVVLALMELQGGEALWVWGAGIALLLGRALHAVGMLYAESPAPRGLGMVLTYIAIAIPALWLLF